MPYRNQGDHMSCPLVSIIMPTYNSERLVGQTIRAALAQSWTNFELIIIDDGSTDGTANVIRAFQDPRIRFLPQACNGGVSQATNTGFAAARGDYIVPMDHDDLSLPDRLTRQVSFLEAHPDLDGCGAGHIVLSRCAALDALKARLQACRKDLVPPAQVAAETLFGGALFNPTMCFRTRLLNTVDHWWDPAFAAGADDDFYERLLAAGAQMTILPESVLRYRRHAGNLSRKKPDVTRQTRTYISRQAVGRLVPAASEQELLLHDRIVLRSRDLNLDDIPAVRNWFVRLAAANTAAGRFANEALLQVLARHWSRVCALAACHNLRQAFAAYRDFPLVAPYTGSPFLLFYQWQKRWIGGKR